MPTTNTFTSSTTPNNNESSEANNRTSTTANRQLLTRASDPSDIATPISTHPPVVVSSTSNFLAERLEFRTVGNKINESANNVVGEKAEPNNRNGSPSSRNSASTNSSSINSASNGILHEKKRMAKLGKRFKGSDPV